MPCTGRGKMVGHEMDEAKDDFLIADRADI
jgi:hypothetical protein